MENLISAKDYNLILNEVHNFVRYISPITREIYESNEAKMGSCNGKCYEFWGKERPCDNCISMRAINENRTQIKIECNNDKVYIVMAYPISKDTKKCVLELINEITDVGLDEILGNKAIGKMKNKIQLMNEGLVKDMAIGVYNRQFYQKG